MKALVVFGVILFVVACTKSDIKPSPISLSATSEDASIVKNSIAVLAAHPWMYQGFYFHYVNRNAKGDPEYIRGSNKNAINLDDTRITFNKNGHFIEIDGGYTYPGTWAFSNNDSTLTMNYLWGADVCTIINFNKGHLYFTQPMGYHQLSFTELIPTR